MNSCIIYMYIYVCMSVYRTCGMCLFCVCICMSVLFVSFCSFFLCFSCEFTFITTSNTISYKKERGRKKERKKTKQNHIMRVLCFLLPFFLPLRLIRIYHLRLLLFFVSFSVSFSSSLVLLLILPLSLSSSSSQLVSIQDSLTEERATRYINWQSGMIKQFGEIRTECFLAHYCTGV